MKKIFWITPYSQDKRFKNKYNIITSISNSLSFNLTMATTDIRKFPDIEHTVELMKLSDLVIADLSFERPSCYFEIGFTQSLNKEMLLLAETDTEIHFVLNQESVRYYSDLSEYHKIIHDFLAK